MYIRPWSNNPLQKTPLISQPSSTPPSPQERLQVDERVTSKVLSKRSGVGGLDDAGRLHKKPKG